MLCARLARKWRTPLPIIDKNSPKVPVDKTTNGHIGVNLNNKPRPAADVKAAKALSDVIIAILDENSAQDVIEIDISGKSSVADFMIVASGLTSFSPRSPRVLQSRKDLVCSLARFNSRAGSRRSLRRLGYAPDCPCRRRYPQRA